jgi:bla regulator protein blaR1
MTIPALSPLANHLWQSTIFVCIAWLLALALRKNRAAVRYWIWFAASVKFLIPLSFLISAGSHLSWRDAPALVQPQVSLAMERISQPFAAPVSEPLPPVTPALSPANPAPAILAGIWLCGIAAGVVFWVRRFRHLHSVVRAATPIDLDLPIRAFSSRERLEPGIAGIFQPVLLLPEGIRDRLTSEQLAAIVAHELRHVARRDNITAAIHMLVETIFWFHPATWWIRQRLVEERERACDQEVLEMGREPLVYAEGILRVCEHYLASPASFAAGVAGGKLTRRIEMIVSNQFASNLTLRKKLALCAAAAVAIAFPLAVGATRPSSAQHVTRDYRFEVASIKPADPTGRMTGPPQRSSPGHFRTNSTTIPGLAMRAFGIKQAYQIKYQPWMSSTYFNVEAIMPEGAAMADLPIMIQHLLEDRFGLVFHRETKQMAGYELVVAKSGLKLAKSAAAGSSGEAASKVGDIEMKSGMPQFTKDAGSGQLYIDSGMTAIWRGRNKTLDSLAADLAQEFGAPVIDATGIKGEYDYELVFAPEAKTTSEVKVVSPLGVSPAKAPHWDESPTHPLLRDALEIQLGLLLRPVKNVPVKIVVLDSAKKPTEN